MPSLVYFKFKASLAQYNIPFEGSAISLEDLKSAIRLKHGMKSTDFDLIVKSTEGKDYSEKDLIPAYSSLIVSRMPVFNSKPINKTINPENFNKNDPYRTMRNKLDVQNMKAIDVATADLTEDQKQDLVAELGSKIYNVPRRMHLGPIPSHYLCNKCNISGHWIKDCPGIPDKDGKMLESKSVKRPSGIPTSNLREVDSGTPNSYLTMDGRYVVNTKNHEAYLKGKKDKRPFSKEENPPMRVTVEDKPACLVCGICDEIFRDPVSTPCCSKAYCKQCALDTIFDDEKLSFHQCPNCKVTIDVLDSLADEILLGRIVDEWRQKKLSHEQLEGFVVAKKAPDAVTKLTKSNAITDDDLTDDIFGFSDKENLRDRIMLVNDNQVFVKPGNVAKSEPKVANTESTANVIPVLSNGKINVGCDRRRDYAEHERCRDAQSHHRNHRERGRSAELKVRREGANKDLEGNRRITEHGKGKVCGTERTMSRNQDNRNGERRNVDVKEKAIKEERRSETWKKEETRKNRSPKREERTRRRSNSRSRHSPRKVDTKRDLVEIVEERNKALPNQQSSKHHHEERNEETKKEEHTDKEERSNGLKEQSKRNKIQTNEENCNDVVKVKNKEKARNERDDRRRYENTRKHSTQKISEESHKRKKRSPSHESPRNKKIKEEYRVKDESKDKKINEEFHRKDESKDKKTKEEFHRKAESRDKKTNEEFYRKDESKDKKTKEEFHRKAESKDKKTNEEFYRKDESKDKKTKEEFHRKAESRDKKTNEEFYRKDESKDKKTKEEFHRKAESKDKKTNEEFYRMDESKDKKKKEEFHRKDESKDKNIDKRECSLQNQRIKTEETRPDCAEKHKLKVRIVEKRESRDDGSPKYKKRKEETQQQIVEIIHNGEKYHLIKIEGSGGEKNRRRSKERGREESRDVQVVHNGSKYTISKLGSGSRRRRSSSAAEQTRRDDEATKMQKEETATNDEKVGRKRRSISPDNDVPMKKDRHDTKKKKKSHKNGKKSKRTKTKEKHSKKSKKNK